MESLGRRGAFLYSRTSLSWEDPILRGRTIALVVSSLLVAASTAGALAATPRCRGERATVVGNSGDNHLVGTAKRDVIAGLGGNDFIESLGGSDLVCGGAGSDDLYAGGGNDVVLGGGGGDDLVGGGGSDTLLSGGSSDYLNGGTGDDTIDGGRAGFDYADFRTSTAGVVVDLEAETATGDGNDAVRRVEMLAGSPFDDELRGASGDFELYLGLAGNDVIDGRDGFDQLIFEESGAGVTADSVAGTASGEGDDTYSSIESLVGSNFDDTLRGHDESDDIYGLAGNDIIDGRGGDDYLLGNSGDDDIAGGAGEYDMLDFDPSVPAVVVDEPAGTSTGDGSDLISSFEIIGGTPNDDTLIGDESDDLFYPYSGDDAVDGGGGEDLVIYNLAGQPISADLAAGTASGEGNDSLAAVEGFVGSAFGDRLIGDSNDNVLIGGSGPDELSGADGDDYIEGGAGPDQIDGGPGGFDMSDYFAAPGGVVANLDEGAATGHGDDALAGVEALLGSPFDDVFIGDSGPNFLFGAAGDDELNGRDGDDGLDGGAGEDALDGGLGSDDCFAGETDLGCETGSQTEPAVDVAALQALAGILSEVLERGF